MKHLLIFSLVSFFFVFNQAVAIDSGHAGKSVLVKPTPANEKTAADTSSGGKPKSEAVNSDAAAPTDKIVRLATPTSDAQTEKILNSLAEQAGWFLDLKLKVQDGMVTITGKTKDSTHLEWLAKTADRLPYVIAVINQAQIETPAVWDLSPVVSEIRALIEKTKKALPRISLACIMLVLFYFIGRKLSKLIHMLWGRSITNLFLHGTISKLTMMPVWIFFFYLTLQIAGLENLATTIIGGTGAVGLILGFAFKDIMSNYLSGILLAIRSPFTKGDEIQIDNYQGFIQSLNMRGTTIIDYDGNLILIPNATVTQSVIINKSITQKKRTVFYVKIAYRDSAPRALEIIEQVLKKFPDILNDPKPLVIAEKFSEMTIDLKILFWFDAAKSSGDKIKSSALGLICEALLAEGFMLPGSLTNVLVQDQSDKRNTAEENAALNTVEQKTATAQDHAPDHEQEIKRIGQGADIMRKSSDALVKE